jgi:ABC-type glycerol-3-phosphate transport system substrate-binding protein
MNGGVDILVIPTHSPDIADSELFLEFMANEGLDTILPNYGNTPPYLNVAPSSLKALGSVDAAVIGESNKLGFFPGWDSVVPAQLGQPWENPELEKMLLGDLTPAQTAAAFQARWQALRTGKLGAVLAK